MNNESYYGVTRTDEYLAHYGIRGMKWGIRKDPRRADGNGRRRAIGVGAGIAAGGAAAVAAMKLRRRAARLANAQAHINNLGKTVRSAANAASKARGGVHSAIEGGLRVAGKTGLVGVTRAAGVGANASKHIANLNRAKTAAQGYNRVVEGGLRAVSASGANAARHIANLDRARLAAKRSGAVVEGGLRTMSASSTANAARHIANLEKARAQTQAAAQGLHKVNEVGKTVRKGLSNAQIAGLAGAGLVGAGLAGYGIYRGVKAYKARKARNARAAGNQYSNNANRYKKKRYR